MVHLFLINKKEICNWVEYREVNFPIIYTIKKIKKDISKKTLQIFNGNNVILKRYNLTQQVTFCNCKLCAIGHTLATHKTLSLQNHNKAVTLY